MGASDDSGGVVTLARENLGVRVSGWAVVAAHFVVPEDLSCVVFDVVFRATERRVGTATLKVPGLGETAVHFWTGPLPMGQYTLRVLPHEFAHTQEALATWDFNIPEEQGAA